MKKKELMANLGLDPKQADNIELSYSKAGWAVTTKVKNSKYIDIIDAFAGADANILKNMEEYNEDFDEGIYQGTYFENNQLFDEDKFLNAADFKIRAGNIPFKFKINTELRFSEDGSEASPTKTFILHLSPEYQYDFEVDWGDGNSETINVVNGIDITHVYDNTGEYSISCIGLIPRLNFSCSPSSGLNYEGSKIIDIEAWGTNQWQSVYTMFNFCDNLGELSAQDIPNLSKCDSMAGMFSRCPKFNGGTQFKNWDVSTIKSLRHAFSKNYGKVGADTFNSDLTYWDVSNVENFESCFEACKGFNGDISKWNTKSAINFKWFMWGCNSFSGDISNWNMKNATNTKSMLNRCYEFDCDLSGWDMSKVESTEWMFYECKKFNGDIRNWDIRNVKTMRGMLSNCFVFDIDISDWDMSKVERIENMFYGATIFNQPIGKWDLSSVVITAQNDYVDSMLELCEEFNQDLSNWPWGQWGTFHDGFKNSPKFNQDISKWDISSMTSAQSGGFRGAFEGSGMTTENYDLALEAWANETYCVTPQGMWLGMQTTKYSVAQQANRDILVNTYGWNIQDAGSVV